MAKEIAAEEEMNRNIMVFGLVEEENENIDVKINELFEDLMLREKTKNDPKRLG